MAARESRALYRTWRVLHTHSFGLLGLLAAATFGLGCYGFLLAFANQHVPYRPLDIAYDALQLFTVEFGPGSALQVDNVYLEFARFFAPLLTFVSVISLVMVHYLNRYLLAVYLRFLARDHVVVCGLGQLGPEVAERLTGEDRAVIVIEPDRDHPGVEACRSAGAYVLRAEGDAASVLRHVAIDRASDLFILSKDDAKNLDIAETARTVCNETRTRREPLHCYCHLGDAQLCANVRGKALLAAAHSTVFLEPFNIHQIAGYCMMHEAGPLEVAAGGPASPSPGPHVLIVGAGRMGEALLVRLARAWRETRPASGQRLRITLVDRRPNRPAEIVSKYIRLERYAEVSAIPLEIGNADALLQNVEVLRALRTASHLYYCIDDPSLGLAIALALAGTATCTGTAAARAKGCTIHVLATRETGLTSLMGHLSASLPECRPIREFVITRCACCLDIVRWGMSEQMARLNHEQYLEGLRDQPERDGVDAVVEQPLERWDDLPEDLKVANRDQARFIGTMLARAGFTVAPLTDWDEAPVDFEEIPWPEGGTLLERMAEWEHDRWVEERRTSGWTYADIPEKDPARKRHPCMKAYHLLDPDIREKDRHYVRSIPGILYRMDLKLVRIGTGAACGEAAESPASPGLGP